MATQDVSDPCCSDPHIITSDDGFAVCQHCGVVINNERLVTQVRRTYNTEEYFRRADHAPMTGSGNFHSSTIMYIKPTDNMTATNRHKYLRLAKINRSLSSSKDRNYWDANQRLVTNFQRLHVPTVVKETAWRIYTTVVGMKLMAGRSIEAFLAASFYVASRIHHHPVMMNEILEIVNTKERIIHRCLTVLLREVLPTMKLHCPTVTLAEMICKIGEHLGISPKLQQESLHILKNAQKSGLITMGKDPRGVAASAIYLSSRRHGIRMTQKEICAAAKITEVTLRNNAKQIAYYVR